MADEQRYYNDSYTKGSALTDNVPIILTLMGEVAGFALALFLNLYLRRTKHRTTRAVMWERQASLVLEPSDSSLLAFRMNRKTSPEEKANFFSRSCFLWMKPLIKKSYKADKA